MHSHTTLFADLSRAQLEAIFRQPTDSACAHLLDPTAQRRARRRAQATALWQELDALDPDRPIPALRRSDYRAYRRRGDRQPADAAWQAGLNELGRAALAVWLDHPRASVDYVQDLLWATCDCWTWVGTAHEEHNRVDLMSTGTAIMLAETLEVLGDRIEPEVRERVHQTIQQRIFDRFDRPPHWWQRCHMNWNHVCNGNGVRLALLLKPDPADRARWVHRLVRNMQFALDGFADDGGCLEGPGYWSYGFGHFVQTAWALHQHTRGKINLMTSDPKIERICRYPLAVQIAGDQRATFADGGHGWIPAEIALLIGRFFDLPELLGCCQHDRHGHLTARTWHELALDRGRRPPRARATDALLPDLGLVRLRSAPGPHQMTVMALAGHNGVPHNHNDVGSFMVYRQGRELLTDPGAPRYTAKTFSNRRYEILFCNSLGHSVPLIGDTQQGVGPQFQGRLVVTNLDQARDKSVFIDMAGAYPEGTVRALGRTLTLDYARHALTIEDRFRFVSDPPPIVETFVTFESARTLRGGRAVQLGPRAGGACLRAEHPGRFEVVAETDAAAEGATGRVLRRVLFRPAQPLPHLVLRFRLA